MNIVITAYFKNKRNARLFAIVMQSKLVKLGKKSGAWKYLSNKIPTYLPCCAAVERCTGKYLYQRFGDYFFQIELAEGFIYIQYYPEVFCHLIDRHQIDTG